MSRDKKIRKVLRSVNGFLLFFLLVSFVITCCMMLFLSVLSASLNIEFTGENLNMAAKLTLGNVVLLSLLISVFDAVRRKLSVDRPAKMITDAAEKIMAGDFSARIKINRGLYREDRFIEIAECFNKMAEELASIETLRTDFIANVSHELKTPLSVIKNYGTLLGQPNLEEEKRLEYAKAITLASTRLASLISNILKLNKLENQQITPHFEVYNLSEQVCECILGFEDTLEKKELNVETEIEDDVLVSSDREMMTLVWNNLFSNAIKFTDKGGKISLSVKTDGEYAVVTVADTGCGISEEIGKHMFDKFYQGDTSHSKEGNGLGLALVKRVIDIIGCDISVESELGIGTAFTLRMKRETI